jgi:hypothetical protein
MTRADRQRRRTAVALAASAMAHVAVFGLLARYTPVFHPLWAAARDFQIELVPAAPLPAPSGQVARPGAATQTAPAVTPRTAKSAPRHTDVATTTPYPLHPRALAAQTPRPAPSPSRPAPPPASPPARILLPGADLSGAAAGAPGWPAGPQGAPNGAQSEGDSEGAGVRGALRTSVGCDDPDYYNLSKAERAVCARQFGVQAAIGARQYVDPIKSGQVRNKYEQDRQACERLNHYATPLDSDREHSASAPGTWGLGKLKC